jgi:DNA-binding beta-propeller fold protein YncE
MVKKILIYSGLFLFLFFTNSIFLEAGNKVPINYEFTNSSALEEITNSMTGIRIEEDKIILESEIETFDYLWVANTYDSTLSKIDTTSNEAVARYRTALPGETHLPSRTAVDKEGFVYVGNRQGDRSIVKVSPILERCVDKNNDGNITTSQNHTDILNWGEDECVLWSVNHWPELTYSVGPRALAVDLEGYLWVGIWELSKSYKLNPENGEVVAIVDHPNVQPYGAAISGEGILWVVDQHNLKILGINTTSNEPLIEIPMEFKKGALEGNLIPYGIVLDKKNNIWFGNYQRDPPFRGGLGHITLNKTNYSNYTLDWIAIPNSRAGRGVTLDKQGNIWLGDSTDRKAIKINSSSHEKICENNLVGEDPIGIVTDNNGDLWSISRKNNMTTKLNVDNCSSIISLPLGEGPYTYSDATGFLISQFFNEGEWTSNEIGRNEELEWTNISWEVLGIEEEGDKAILEITFIGGESNGKKIVFETASNGNYFKSLEGNNSEKIVLRITLNRKPMTFSEVSLGEIEINALGSDNPPILDLEIGECVIERNSTSCINNTYFNTTITANWTWGENNTFQDEISCQNYVSASGGNPNACINDSSSLPLTWHYDPENKASQCVSRVTQGKCPILQLNFFGMREFLFSLILIFGIYFLSKDNLK